MWNTHVCLAWILWKLLPLDLPGGQKNKSKTEIRGEASLPSGDGEGNEAIHKSLETAMDHMMPDKAAEASESEEDGGDGEKVPKKKGKREKKAGKFAAKYI